MKKTNYINKIVLLISLVTLTSCTFYDYTSSSNSMTTSQDSNTTVQVTSDSSLDTTSNTTSEDYTTNNTTQSSTTTTDSNTTSNIEQLGYYKAETLRYNVKDAQDSMGYYSLNTTGRQKLLVVPVQLRGATQWTSNMLSRLETAFFGTPDETNYWESVSSYYSKSSYEKLTLEGEVIDPIQLNYSVSQLSSYNRFSDIISDYIVPAFDQQVDSQIKQEYDQDKDSYIDATIFVYSNPYDGDAYWAWVWYLQDQNASISNPSVGNYMWASYEFMNDSGTNRIDAHTYIHETGHLLGLDDLYTSDGRRPTGSSTMMDQNIGDLDPYSKLALGWITPYVVYGSSEILLPYNTYNDHSVIVIPSNWEEISEEIEELSEEEKANYVYEFNPFSEYMLIDLYSPLGVNYKDTYGDEDGDIIYGREECVADTGVRIYHVDSRIFKCTVVTSDLGTTPSWDKNNLEWEGEQLDDNEAIIMAISNERDESQRFQLDEEFNYFERCRLLEAHGTNTFDLSNLTNQYASSETLWGVDDKVFDILTYGYQFFNGMYTYNDGNDLPFKISVKTLQEVKYNA